MIVCLHGFLGSPALWDGVAPEGAFCPWLPGHGVLGPSTEARGFEAAVEELAPLVPEGSLVVGYSMGARLALALALRHPERVSRALLIAPDPGIRTPEARAERAARDGRDARAIREHGLPSFVADWESRPLFATQTRLSPAILAAQRRERLGHTASGIAWALQTLGPASMPSYWEPLSRCPTPLHFVAGSLDPKFVALGEEAARTAPNGRFTLIADTGHNLVLEKPDIVALLITHSLKELTP